jgi:hypothetical protein
MARILWSGFRGESRAPNPKSLPDGVGTISRNVKPTRGDLRAWRQPLTVAAGQSGFPTIYRMGRDVASDANYWLSWSTVVHAIRGFETGDTTERTYYCGDGTPKVTDNIMGLASPPYPTASRPLGIPAPVAAMTVSTISGTPVGDVVDYFYTYTFVNDWGWESGPAPASAVNSRESDLTATLSGFSAAPSGNYNIDRIRIYRTQAGSTGDAAFYLLREIAYGVSSTTDDNRDLGYSLPTYDVTNPLSAWLPAPDDLTQLRAAWAGMAGGISDGALRLCVPYAPYAWPLAYEIRPLDGRAVGWAVFGQAALVLTNGRPWLVAGSSPDSMDQSPVEFTQACVSARSIVGMGQGVAWASNDGLCWYGSGGPRVLTAGLMTRDDWLALNPASIVGSMYEGLYFGSYDNGSGRNGFMVAPGNPSMIFFLDVGYEAMHFDELQDQLYVLDGANIKRWDAGASYLSAVAASKEFYQSTPVAYTFAKVVSDVPADSVSFIAQRLDADVVTAMMAKGVAGLTAPDSTTLRYTVTDPGAKPFRLPPVKARAWVVEAGVSDGDVQMVVMATSLREAASV